MDPPPPHGAWPLFVPYPDVVAVAPNPRPLGLRSIARRPWAERKVHAMVCKECGDEVDELFSVKVGSRRRKVCEDCADRLREEGEIADAAEGAIQDMMEYKGR